MLHGGSYRCLPAAPGGRPALRSHGPPPAPGPSHPRSRVPGPGQGRGGTPPAARRPARPRRACPERAPPAGESRGAPALPPPPPALKGKGRSHSPGRWAAVLEGLPAKQTSGKRPAEPKEGFGRVGAAPGALSLLASWQFPSVQTHQEGVVGFKR